MRRIVLLACALVGIVYVRTTVAENIHPWELLWLIWVGATCLTSGCLGYVIRDVIEDRRHHKPNKLRRD